MRLYLIIAFALAVAGAAFGLYRHGVGQGRAACMASVTGAMTKYLEASRKGIIDATHRLQKEEDRINAAPDTDNGPLAPVLRGQLERLHNLKN